jgi:hypothetical protein
MNIRIPITTNERAIDIEKVGRKPAVSAIQPPNKGARMVAGAFNVWESPM